MHGTAFTVSLLPLPIHYLSIAHHVAIHVPRAILAARHIRLAGDSARVPARTKPAQQLPETLQKPGPSLLSCSCGL
jgi:hypothetical protein